ncbi:unnamed protein product [Pelagomonas calceolata]|uniref:MYND-type domain-containing protein n=1 Tax=Pelagomonas calceolata TaxID=35677 RepID=A0A8J2X3R7_9STRA|nr:unnamed protein product [Pelagomonas calceolata]
MILTTCAACAAPLAHDAPRCVRCWTRYCDSTCQHDHWRRGHKQMCKKIHRGGNAEQYHADKKYKEAVAVAVEACADDTKGQTCYICTQALHWKTKEGLVRGCSCRGTAGFVHVSCLAEQAKILMDEAEENNLSGKVRTERFHRWHTCRLCEQQYHGVVSCALGWACWKTYLGRPEGDQVRSGAMTTLGSGLCDAKHYEEAVSVQEAELSMMRRLGDSEHMLITQGNLAMTYHAIGRMEEALRLRQEVYSGTLKLHGEERRETLIAANNYATSLGNLERWQEVNTLMRDAISVARRVLGENDEMTLRMRSFYARTLQDDDVAATLEDLREAVTTLEDTARTARRVLGGAHPTSALIERELRNLREKLRANETPEKLAQEAFRTARAKLAQEREELAQTLADSSAKPSQDA